MNKQELEAVQAARKSLLRLVEERKECRELVEKGERAAERLRQLDNYFGRLGEVTLAKRAYRDALAGPILESSNWNTTRVIAVDDNWITLRSDRDADSEVQVFRRSDGKEKGSRSRYATTIDVDLAVRLWEEWVSTPEPSADNLDDVKYAI